MVVSTDNQTLYNLVQLNRRNSETRSRDVFACVWHQPRPSRIAVDITRFDSSAAFKDARTPWRLSHYQLGACSPQLSLALRFRTCLTLIEHAEQQRGALEYTWVVRSRPDISLPCALCLHTFVLIGGSRGPAWGRSRSGAVFAAAGRSFRPGVGVGSGAGTKDGGSRKRRATAGVDVGVGVCDAD